MKNKRCILKCFTFFVFFAAFNCEKQYSAENVVYQENGLITYSESPLLAERVKKGEFPAVKDRLPDNPRQYFFAE